MRFLIWLCLVFSGCTYTASQLRGKSSDWLDQRLRVESHISQQILLIKEMEMRRDPVHIGQLLRFAYSSDRELALAAFVALNSYDGRYEGRDVGTGLIFLGHQNQDRGQKRIEMTRNPIPPSTHRISNH